MLNDNVSHEVEITVFPEIGNAYIVTTMLKEEEIETFIDDNLKCVDHYTYEIMDKEVHSKARIFVEETKRELAERLFCETELDFDLDGSDRFIISDKDIMDATKILEINEIDYVVI